MSEAKTQDIKTKGSGNVMSFRSTGGNSVFGVDFDVNTKRVTDRYADCEADSKAKSDGGPRTLTFTDASGKTITIKAGEIWTNDHIDCVHSNVMDTVFNHMITQAHQNAHDIERRDEATYRKALDGVAGTIAEEVFKYGK